MFSGHVQVMQYNDELYRVTLHDKEHSPQVECFGLRQAQPALGHSQNSMPTLKIVRKPNAYQTCSIHEEDLPRSVTTQPTGQAVNQSTKPLVYVMLDASQLHFNPDSNQGDVIFVSRSQQVMIDCLSRIRNRLFIDLLSCM